MSERYPGGFITKSPPALNPALGNAAPGIWTMDQVMQAVKNGTWPAYDPYFEYTTLLLHGNGTNGAQNNTFLDASTNNFTITRNGNTTQGSFSPYGTLWSAYFDGTTGLNDTGAGLIGTTTSTFSVEGWVCLTAAPTGSAQHGSLVGLNANFTTTTNYLSFGPDTGQKLRLFWYDGSDKSCYGSTTLNVGVWYHIALVVNSNAISMYVNGVAESLTGTTTLTNRSGTAGQFNIGKNGQTQFKGYASNIRISDNARTITVPTAPYTSDANTLVLACNQNSFASPAQGTSAITWESISGSVTNFAPFSPTAAYSAATVGGSGYFDGTGDYLTSSCGNVGTGDFTIEGWFYFNTTPSTMGLFQASSTSGGFVSNQTANLAVATSSSSTWQIYAKNTFTISSSTSVPVRSWGHMALVRNGTTTVLYINGAAVITLTSDSTNYSTSFIGLGGIYDNTSYLLNGFLANFRVVVGTAVYTAAFTPPTAPLTAITNTQLLCNFTNAGIIDNAMMNDLETVGNAQISTAQSKFGGSSLYFDGSGDSLVAPSNPIYAFGTGNFTFECWLYINALPGGVAGIFDTGTGVNASRFSVVLYSSGKIYVDNDTNLLISNASLSVGQWYHIAVARTNTGTNQTRIFINGNLDVSGTVSTNFSSSNCRVGQTIDNFSLNGYLYDVRVTKGYARYTANFTPPTSQLQDQ